MLPLYKEVLQSLVDAGASYIQIDEPVLVTDESQNFEAITKKAYDYFEEAGLSQYLVIQTYFERVDLKFLNTLPAKGYGLDFVHDHGHNLQQIQDGHLNKDKALYAGIIDGRNVWAADIEAKKELIETLQSYTDELVIQPSSSLLHVPVSLDDESLDESIAEGLSFATEKLGELNALKRYFNENDDTAYNELKERYHRFQNQAFKNVSYDFDSVRTSRQSDFSVRKEAQNNRLHLPD